VLPFRSEDGFLTYVKNDTSLDVLAGVIFRGNFRDSFPDDVEITLRFRPDPVNVPPGQGSPFTGMYVKISHKTVVIVFCNAARVLARHVQYT